MLDRHRCDVLVYQVFLVPDECDLDVFPLDLNAARDLRTANRGSHRISGGAHLGGAFIGFVAWLLWRVGGGERDCRKVVTYP